MCAHLLVMLGLPSFNKLLNFFYFFSFFFLSFVFFWWVFLWFCLLDWQRWRLKSFICLVVTTIYIFSNCPIFSFSSQCSDAGCREAHLFHACSSKRTAIRGQLQWQFLVTGKAFLKSWIETACWISWKWMGLSQVGQEFLVVVDLEKRLRDADTSSQLVFPLGYPLMIAIFDVWPLYQHDLREGGSKGDEDERQASSSALFVTGFE